MVAQTAGTGTTLLSMLLVVATSVWIGGYATAIVVARVASRTLGRSERVAFFRLFGRVYGIVTGAALVVGIVVGAVLLRQHAWDGLMTTAAVLAAAIIAATVIGVVQARHMTRLRAHAAQHRDDPQAAARVRRGGRNAAVLRGLIGALSLALLAVGVLLAG